MHCSIWRFEGDPDDLEQRYLAVMAEIPESTVIRAYGARSRLDESSS